MEYTKLRKKAEKKVKAKKGYITTATTFGAISVVLFIISIQIGGDAGFWIRLPILIFCMVLVIMYVAIFGLPGSDYFSPEWHEDQVQNEMGRIASNMSTPKLLDREYIKLGYREEDFV